MLTRKAKQSDYGRDVPDRNLQLAMIEVVLERMTGRGLTVNGLARKTGLLQQNLDNHLYRKRGTIGMDEWERIAEGLGESLDDLIAAGKKRRGPRA